MMQKCCFPKLKKTPAEVDSGITKCVNNVLSNVRDDSDAAVTGVGGRGEGQTCRKNSPLASFANKEEEEEVEEVETMRLLQLGLS